MRFRETAKIQTVLAGGKLFFRRDTGYRITLANGTLKIYKARELKAMSEADFVTNVLELDVSTVTLLETEDRKTPPRFAPKSAERAAEVKARKDRIRKRKARKAAKAQPETVEVTLTVTAPAEDAAETSQRVAEEMAAEMGVTLIETPAVGETA
jgi:hypothetical protein